MIETGTQTAWIVNTGIRPSMLRNNEKVQIWWSDNTTGTYPVQSVYWDIVDIGTYCTHWRRANNLTLDDAYDTPPKEEPPYVTKGVGQVKILGKLEYPETTFEKMADKFWESVPKYPETTYEPLPIQPSQNALVASIFNTLYPEPCAMREVHVEALKAIMKLVEERGGE